MAARRRADAEPLNEPAKQAAASDSGIYLDPRLVEVREAEIKRNDVTVEPRPAVTIADELIEAREAEIKRGDRKLV